MAKGFLIVTLSALVLIPLVTCEDGSGEVDDDKNDDVAYTITPAARDYVSDNKVLTGHILATTHSHMVTGCFLKCKKVKACLSFNYFEKTGICELNAKSHEETGTVLAEKDGWQYLDRNGFTTEPVRGFEIHSYFKSFLFERYSGVI